MRSDNLLSVTIDPATMDSIQQAVTTIKDQLPFLKKLTPVERRKIARYGDKSQAFVEKAHDYAVSNPHLVPPYLDVAEFKRDYELVRGLARIMQSLKSLTEAVDDTRILAGRESYQSARVFYSSAKRAANSGVQGTQSIVDDLAQRFPGRSRKSVKPVDKA